MKAIYCVCDNTYKLECKECEDSVFRHYLGNTKGQGVQVKVDETTTRTTSSVSTGS